MSDEALANSETAAADDDWAAAMAEQATAAKFICGTCPIRSACLRWALDTGQEAGVWGGTSEEDRRAMRRTGRTDQALPVSA